MRFKIIAALLFLSASSWWASGATTSGGQLVENFTSMANADLTATTGLWNIVDNVAQAAVVANEQTTRALAFGNGTLGAVSSGGGYTFNTDLFPNGFNFVSLSITAGAITVTGSNPLIIRSLSTVYIDPAVTLSVAGSNGTNGTANASTTAPAGGAATACPVTGGAGGAATNLAGSNGSNAIQSDSTTEAGTGGAGVTGAGAASSSNASTTGPNTDFDDPTQFICGTSGGGGGGHSQGGGGNFATGGSGGAGGGTIRITAVGNITAGTTTAAGGNGGNGLNDGTACSGHGSGGVGGAIWLQTFRTIAAATPAPTVSGGTSGAGGGCGAGSGAALSGVSRGDSSSAATRPAWAAGAGNYNTQYAAPSQTYVVQSKTYDLDTLNASFDTAPSVTQTLNGGSISVQYAGSIDGTAFSPLTSDITTLSNKNYRYLKFRITITTSAAANTASPTVSRIAIAFRDLGLADLDLSLSAGLSGGCGTIQNTKHNSTHRPHIPWLLMWMSFWCVLYITFRYHHGFVRKARRVTLAKTLPAGSWPAHK